MKRKNAAPAPKKPNRGLSCALFLLASACGAIFLGSQNTTRPRVAPTSTVVAAAATNSPEVTARRTRNITPSATITDTSTPTPSRPTDAPSETWYTISAANLRSCPETSCDVVARLEASTAVMLVGFEQGETVQGSDIWRIVDYDGQQLYIHSSLVTVNPPRPTSRPPARVNTSVPAQVVQPTANPGLVCPRNCDEAIALGWTAQQAGQCSNLDRDDDGVACYGD